MNFNNALFCILLSGSLFSCTSRNESTPHEVQTKQEIKIAKTVPDEYKKVIDTNFHNHQDTVYYKDKMYSGYRYAQYPDGDTAEIQSFFNGVEEGFQRQWFPGKQHVLAEERFYINGKKEGKHRKWWPDGRPRMEFDAYSNEYNGEFREWYSSGLLGKDFHYVNGQEEGSQRLWWDNGTVRANYVIRNGKKYGLIGLKLCSNPKDTLNEK